MSMMSSTMPAGCWELDLATGTLTLCPQSRTMFGLSPGSSGRLAEKEWANRLHPDDLGAVQRALAACLSHQRPYAERFRTVHPDGGVQLVLGIGRPLEENGKTGRFVGWNFDAVSAGEMAGDWIAAHPEALSAEHLFSVRPSSPTPDEALPERLPHEALLARARSILRIRRSGEQLLSRAIMGEPAFDLLLCLYVRPGQAETSLSSLASSAGIPNSSALRWILYLADKGLVLRAESKSDRRAICIQLAPSGRALMDEILGTR